MEAWASWQFMIRNNSANWKHTEICESFIPKTHDFVEKSALKPYMLDILTNAGLKPRMCEVLSVSRTVRDLHRLAEAIAALIPCLPLVPEESRPQLRTDLTDILRNLLCSDAADTEFRSENFVVHATKR